MGLIKTFLPYALAQMKSVQSFGGWPAFWLWINDYIGMPCVKRRDRLWGFTEALRDFYEALGCEFDSDLDSTVATESDHDSDVDF